MLLPSLRFLAAALVLLASPVVAQHLPGATAVAGAAPSVEQILNPDGTVRAGAVGSFDAHGYRLGHGPGGAPVLRPAGPGDQYWQAGFDQPGADDWVWAVAIAPTGDVYIGGKFRSAGLAPADHVARWDGAAWSGLGAGVNGNVRALAIAGTDVYVGGSFTQAGGAPAAHVARWNGTAWSALGAGVDNDVWAIAVAGPNVYVGGTFTSAGGAPAEKVAHWDGTAWSALGAGVNDRVNAVAVLGPEVYVGGRFTQAGGAPADHIAKWNGTAWSPVGAGLNREVNAITVAGTDVYVGGRFKQASGAPGNGIAKWNGTTWSALGAGVDDVVYCIAVSGTDVYVGGAFTQAGAGPAGNANLIAKWDGTTWAGLDTGINGEPRAMAAIGADVYVGGDFFYVGPIGAGANAIGANNVVHWNGTAWVVMGSGINLDIEALTLAPNSDVYVGGYFTAVGSIRANFVAKWDGTTWSALGTGMSYLDGFIQGNTQVRALAFVGADLYAGGRFTHAGGVAANGIARWDGTAWAAVGAGVTNGPGAGEVNALVVAGLDLYVAGGFTEAGGQPANNVARWNGTTWSAVGAGTDGVVYDLAVSGTTLYAGGRFTLAGGAPAVNVARWDGTAWSALGAGAGTATGTAYVRAVAVAGPTVYVGGTFTTAGGAPANHVARWDGSSWNPLGTGLTGIADCNTLTVAGTDLYMGGYCAAVGGIVTSGIARWDGTAWSALGTGLNAQAKAIIVTGTDLYVGGGFTTVGDASRVMSCFAAYRPRATAAATELPTAARLTLFPNPATTTVRLGLTEPSTATVLDATGREVRRAVVDAYRPLDVRGLAPGLYVVRAGAAAARLVVE